jgi:hypothetical protein
MFYVLKESRMSYIASRLRFAPAYLNISGEGIRRWGSVVWQHRLRVRLFSVGTTVGLGRGEQIIVILLGLDKGHRNKEKTHNSKKLVLYEMGLEILEKYK